MIQIASYNLWNGASETYFRLIDFIKEQDIDVLCLQEITGWQNADFARLKDFIDHAGYTDYEYGNSNSEHKLGTLTTLPVTMRTVHIEGFWHCIVETHINVEGIEIAIFNLDLDPWGEEPRLNEIERLLKTIDMSKPTIITGNLNSLSRKDNYPSEFLLELQRQGITKFGQGELDFRVTDRLSAAGFIDVAAQLRHLEVTMPSPYNTGEAKELPARLDYMFVTDDLLPLVRDFTVMKNKVTDKISDHYPIVMTLGKLEEKQEITAAPPTNIPQLTIVEPMLEIEEKKNTASEGEIKLH